MEVRTTLCPLDQVRELTSQFMCDDEDIRNCDLGMLDICLAGARNLASVKESACCGIPIRDGENENEYFIVVVSRNCEDNHGCVANAITQVDALYKHMYILGDIPPSMQRCKFSGKVIFARVHPEDFEDIESEETSGEDVVNDE